MYGNSNILVSDKSKVKYPKKLILIEERINIENGKINEMYINTLLILFNQSFWNSIFSKRNIVDDEWN